MLTSWKTILAFTDETDAGEKITDHAADLAQRCGAHLVGVYGITGHPGEFPADAFARGKAALGAVIARRHAAETDLAATAGRRFAAATRKRGINSGEFRVIWSGRGAEDAFVNSLRCDLMIVGHPHAAGLPRSWSAERLAIASGVPALLIPESWPAERAIGQNILIGWNASREARRAMVDAMPLLSLATSVTVVVVDAARTPDLFGAEPGADISLVLCRHNIPVQLRQVTSGGGSVAEAILASATEAGCDLIAIGAYSHARTAELIFGGVTRELLARTSVPILLSH